MYSLFTRLHCCYYLCTPLWGSVVDRHPVRGEVGWHNSQIIYFNLISHRLIISSPNKLSSSNQTKIVWSFHIYLTSSEKFVVIEDNMVCCGWQCFSWLLSSVFMLIGEELQMIPYNIHPTYQNNEGSTRLIHNTVSIHLPF